ncbi:hypothetical protein GCM10014715_30890 [Streptomyces spiralis]|uniref:Uncharacterized protein n=1 Tax=Streptomyces spiralis TaxID=66376 RepID=A0A918ZY82_9ACTN|nr:hypothetical protein [Streptomyces spiralis]GHE74146.1 hypothetical protein GCM10014715_30890 [Streptomyces spiralis]
MGRARLEKDGTYHGDLPCRWCEALIAQGGRRRPRRYCNGWHRTKTYVSWVVTAVVGILS